MPKDIGFPPLVNWKILLKGCLGGSMLVAGLVNAWGPVIQAVLFLFGLLILIDGVMVNGKQGVFIVICLIAAVVSGVLTLVLSVTSLAIPYVIIIFLIALFVYKDTIMKPIKRLLYASENEPPPQKKAPADDFD